MKPGDGQQQWVVGQADIENTFDSFVLANAEEVAMVIDWAIMKPGDGNRKYTGANGKPTNAWRYPCESDIEMHHKFIGDFKNGCEASETLQFLQDGQLSARYRKMTL